MSIVHEHNVKGRYLVNTGIEILGVIPSLDSSVYCGRLGNIVKRINTHDMVDPHMFTTNISYTFLCCIAQNTYLHPPHHYCILVITVLRNRLMYQVYNTNHKGCNSLSWHLVYEEVVPADTCLPPAASVSLGLSMLNIEGVGTIN